ncbi:hypothetical protein OX90_11875 [Pseudomonas coronafaciens pv. porri]|uniref:Uncharacterized protein n=1 Tax=Pseudomonas coronafaciens pv. porri TaxID=83964 RepID=A0ABR5JP96_9PSED|nr:hypothetical protein [Pseudomonas coronafaciens]KOP57602.1 hypothetical protein OX88_04580 [Pseudomonas coronafaciens pv. porri]KOP59339.1 hypothetical protein OX90_11875 [Pseudomonas coronafaciens pv. porri]RMU79834.1 hypothetical protein ALP22_00293 [Pseudomonas coronafaciens pv. porri]RMV96925.1 hypothetical protein ALP00_04143 [Pseudomonas coronafaciens pv. porri]RMW07359.1 hypothetical protein ALO99_00197 [Pseudomonas coronafaciens pv. porri]
MRDLRFQQPREIARINERRVAADQSLIGLTSIERNSINELLAAWWADVLVQDAPTQEWEAAQVEQLRGECLALPVACQAVGLAVCDTLTFASTNKTQAVGERLIGESAAAAVRNSTSAIALDRIVGFLSECWSAVEVMIKRLLEDPAWPAQVELITPTTAELSGLLGHRSKRTPADNILLAEEKNSRELGVLAFFWERQRETVFLNEPTLVRLTLLAARDWRSLAHQAEALPLRQLRSHLWSGLHLTEDRDAILALLRAAPPVFAADEWTGCTGALAALVAAIAYVELLHEQLAQVYVVSPDVDAKLEIFVSNEVPEWFTQVVEAALTRSDGRLLLQFLGSSLIREALLPPHAGRPRWSSTLQALSAIRQVLTPNPTIAELRLIARMVEAPSKPAEADHATYLVTAAALGARPTDIIAWYRELLMRSDNDLCQQTKNRRRGLSYETLSDQLGLVAASFDEWRSLWKSLFVTDREHARYFPFAPNALYPSIHLLRTGMELLRQNPSHADAQNFFDELVGYNRCLLSNVTRNTSPIGDELVGYGVDVAPSVFGSDWPQRLRIDPRLLTSAKSRLYFATLLLGGGATFGDATDALKAAGHHLMDAVDEIRKTKRFDYDAHRLCEIIEDAASEHRRIGKGALLDLPLPNLTPTPR